MNGLLSDRRGWTDRVFETAQIINRPRVEVFSFFSKPANLEAITPPWLRFRIVSQSTPEIREGTELTYRLRIHGLPVSWRSRISVWEPGNLFVDEQIRGPYSSWRHTHRFEDLEDGGTLVLDRVVYRLPLGWLGAWIGGRYVVRDVARIFLFRGDRLFDLLNTLPQDPDACTQEGTSHGTLRTRGEIV